MSDVNTFKYEGLRVVLTCHACPEQYDVYKGNEKVAYFRLRHGRFAAYVPPVGSHTVYEARTDGDGTFAEHERTKHLHAALEAVLKELKK